MHMFYFLIRVYNVGSKELNAINYDIE